MSKEELEKMSKEQLLGIIKAQHFEIESLNNIIKEVREYVNTDKNCIPKHIKDYINNLLDKENK